MCGSIAEHYRSMKSPNSRATSRWRRSAPTTRDADSRVLHMNARRSGLSPTTVVLVVALVSTTLDNHGEGEAASDPRTVRVAGIVLKWVRGEKEANFRRAEALIRDAADGGAKIVCTTECFLDGYTIGNKGDPPRNYRDLAE